MRGLAAALFLAQAAGQVVRTVDVGRAASEVKFQQGLVLVLEAGPVVRVLDRPGRERLRIDLKEAMDPAPRQVEVHDFAVTKEGRLGVSVSALYRMGATRRGILEWHLKNPSIINRFEKTFDYQCWKLTAEEKTGFWCLGPGAGKLLHRVGGGGWTALSVLPGDGEGAQGGGLLDGDGGVVRAWLPWVRKLVEAQAETGEIGERDVGWAGEGKALVTMVAGGGRVYALLPLRKKEEVETFQTKYGIFVLGAEGWRRMEGAGEMERGCRLAGVDGDRVVVWNRGARRVEWRGR